MFLRFFFFFKRHVYNANRIARFLGFQALLSKLVRLFCEVWFVPPFVFWRRGGSRSLKPGASPEALSPTGARGGQGSDASLVKSAVASSVGR